MRENPDSFAIREDGGGTTKGKHETAQIPRNRDSAAGIGLALIAMAVYAGSIEFVTGMDTKPADPKAAETRPADAKAADAKEASKAEKKPARKLSGAELYSMHCNRCHPERYPTERTAAQWKTIMLHMQVRANLPARRQERS